MFSLKMFSVLREKETWGSALLMGKSSSNYMRVCGKHFKKEDYIWKLNM
jgi:hypothetical protein